MSYASSELALLEARIAHADKLLQEKQARLAAAQGTRTVPDYAVNPAFAAAAPPKPEPAPAATDAAPPSPTEQQRYQMRPPPPPPSVPSTI